MGDTSRAGESTSHTANVGVPSMMAARARRPRVEGALGLLLSRTVAALIYPRIVALGVARVLFASAWEGFGSPHVAIVDRRYQPPKRRPRGLERRDATGARWRYNLRMCGRYF